MGITVTLPTGSRHEVEPGTTIVAALKAAGADLKGAVAARLDGTVVDLSKPLVAGGEIAPVTAESREGLDVLRHSTRAPHGAGGEAPLPRHADHHRPGDRGRLLLRLQARTRRSRPRTSSASRPRCARSSKQDFPVVREEMDRERGDALLPRAWARTTRPRSSTACPTQRVGLYRQGEFVDLCRGPHVPRTGAHQGLQAHRHRRRLLARRRAQRDAAAHLRHRVRQQGRARRASRAHRGGEEARPPQARQGARPLLASIRSRRAARSSTPRAPSSTTALIELHARPLPTLRLRRGDHAADPRRRAVEALGPLRELPREHVLHRSSTSASSRSSR